MEPFTFKGEADLRFLAAAIQRALPPTCGVWHTAGVLADGVLAQQNAIKLRTPMVQARGEEAHRDDGEPCDSSCPYGNGLAEVSGGGGGEAPPHGRRAPPLWGVTAGSVLAARRLAGSAWICSGFSLSNESFAEPSAAEPAFSAVHSLQAARGWHAQNQQRAKQVQSRDD